jgi:hypothetical protein
MGFPPPLGKVLIATAQMKRYTAQATKKTSFNRSLLGESPAGTTLIACNKTNVKAKAASSKPAMPTMFHWEFFAISLYFTPLFLTPVRRLRAGLSSPTLPQPNPQCQRPRPWGNSQRAVNPDESCRRSNRVRQMIKTSPPGASLTPELLVRRSLAWDHTGKLCHAPPYHLRRFRWMLRKVRATYCVSTSRCQRYPVCWPR